ncbi:uncharacterized protein C2845_PM03G19270 [Panicum miliaceum]|uniref:F-box protein AT5G49610-like beta-propeller domain-containing protein n=1 Tax=Panicum miliaceum TaxID=4540 RepID=A0A3L6TFE4_PANMI|nr:uncharacterized protein C2845_PM03G19270 [Panicum miliaceum]
MLRSRAPRSSAGAGRRLVAEPAFLRRFRARMPPPPLLGFLTDNCGELVFTPVHQPPGGHRTVRFSPPRRAGGDRWTLLGCRHGLALLANRSRSEAVVWDPAWPATGLQRSVPYPRELAHDGFYGLVCDGAVAFAAAGGGAVRGVDCRFSLVLVCANNDCTRASACLYESEPGTWGSVTSTAITSMVRSVTPSSSVMVGNAFYWLLWPMVLVFDMDSQSLAATQRPEACETGGDVTSFEISRTQDGELGLAVLSKLRLRLWARKVDSRGHHAW